MQVFLAQVACLVSRAVMAYQDPKEEKETPELPKKKDLQGNQEIRDNPDCQEHRALMASTGSQEPLVFVAFQGKAQWVNLESRASVAGRACVVTLAYREKLAKH